MNTFNKIKLTVWAVLLTLTLQAQNNPNTQNNQFVPGQILIKLKESAKAQKTSLSSQMKATTLKSYANLGIELWEINQQVNSKQATLVLVEQLNNNPDVEYAEPNYIWYADDGIEPNDPYFSQLWGLNNTGQNDGTADADIDAPEAYCVPLELSEVVVGIVDTGIDYTHEDLAENIWNNLGEDANGNGQVLIKSGDTWIFDPGDENGIDDDGNGYVDDFVGWDFIYNDNNPMDVQSHGTHCAGTVGAVTNNNIGINGVAPNVKLAALKFLGDDGRGYTSDAIEAINYAIAMGIPITSNSWGGGQYSEALYQAIENGANNNHLFITAAGNGSWDGIGDDNDAYDYYPSSYDNDNVISVIATDKNDDITSFSNYGATSVDIGAPGRYIFSTEPGNTYANKSGTSMATPHVAGVAAYVLGAYPGTPYATIKQSLLNAADPIPALNGKCVSNGRLNLYNALQEMGAPENQCDPDSQIPGCHIDDWNALKALYTSTNGNNWINKNGWATHIAPYSSPQANCNLEDLYGVTIDANGRVNQIDLDGGDDIGWTTGSTGNNLTGNLPPEIGDLENLVYLNLKTNQISGTIPPEIANLSNLTNLTLYNNQLTNPIPVEISQMNNLEGLRLDINLFDGSLPSFLGDMNNLLTLGLANNQFTGEIPSNYENLSSLKSLLLEGNDISGNIPAFLGNLTNLQLLYLNINNLTGTIPSQLGNLQNLTRLYLQGNSLTGNIPSQLGSLNSLIELKLNANNLSGEIPASLGNLSNLSIVQLQDNNLSGCYADGLTVLCDIADNTTISNSNNFDTPWEDFCTTGNCIPILRCNTDDWFALKALFTSTNGDSWINKNGWDTHIAPYSSPQANCHLADLYGVRLDNEGRVYQIDLDGGNDIGWTVASTGNNLTGNLPPEIGDLENLVYLNLKTNQISGTIPSEIGNLSNLTNLTLYNNQLTNPIPVEISQMNNLEGLRLDINLFDGSLPSFLGDMNNLLTLGLANNQFTGEIPSNYENLSSLKSLLLEGNDISGNIPAFLGNLTNLQLLYLNINNLTGTIPSQLGNLQNLTRLYLQGNSLTGNIPSQLGNLSSLKDLRLNVNNLTGEIPPSLSSLSNLTIIQLQDNNLSGCYADGLVNLCGISDNADISDGNGFDTPWEDFCATGNSTCNSQVWPGDADNNGEVEFRDMMYWGAGNGNTGASRPNATINWVGQSCPDWLVEVNGINGKHQDANGDGVVDEADRDVITQNMGQTYNFTEYSEATSTLQFTLNPDVSASSGDMFTYEFFIDDADNTVSAHGINASIFFGGLSVGSATVDVTGSSLNPQEVLQEFDMESNTLHFVLTKTDGINSPLNGPIARVVVQILEVDTGDSSLFVKGGSVMQADGTLEEVAGTTVNSTFFETGINDDDVINLTSSTSHANCGIGGKAKVYASSDFAPYTYLWSTGETTQQIDDLSPGFYAVVVTDAAGNVATLEIEVQGQYIPIYDEDGEIIPCVVIEGTTRESGLFLGQAQVDGLAAEPGDRLIAIDENGNTVGLDLMSFFNGIAYINLPVYGDDINTVEDEGMNVGEYFTLQMFDASENVYYNYTLNDQTVEFTGWENTNSAPLAAYNNSEEVYNFSAICSQSINLNAGWNLISFNNSQANKHVVDVFADLIASGNLEFVTGFDNGAKVFDPFGPPFLNTLIEMKDGFGYWVKVTNADALNTSGGCVPIGGKTYDAGWNLIAFPLPSPQSPSIYFADLIAEGNLEFATGFNNGTKTFDPNGPPFLNTLTQLENGLGYWAKVTNASAKTTNNLTNVFSFINGTSNLLINEKVSVINEANEVIARLDVIEDGYLMTTPIYGDDETTAIKEYINKGENLRFSWNGQTANFTTTFKGDYGIEKIHLEFKLDKGVTSTINVFPNPLTDKTNIVYHLEKSENVTISLFNASGKHLITLIENQTQQAGENQIKLIANNLSTGIYYLKLQSNENNVIKKLVISK